MLVVAIICIVADVIALFLTCGCLKRHSQKKKNGIHIQGKKLGFETIVGRPNRYIVKVEYVEPVSGEICRSKVISADSSICQYDNGEEMPIGLVYIKQTERVYWSEESEKYYLFEVSFGFVVAALLLLVGWSVVFI